MSVNDSERIVQPPKRGDDFAVSKQAAFTNSGKLAGFGSRASGETLLR
jgi:hypothetical protein